MNDQELRAALAATEVDTTVLVQQVKQYALKHYEDGGWDVVVECWEDSEIAEHIKDATTLKEALETFFDLVAVWKDRQADAVNSAF